MQILQYSKQSVQRFFSHFYVQIYIMFLKQQAKQDKVLSTEMEMNRGFQHTIDKLSGEKESLEKKIQELAKKIIVKQQKESNTVEEKEASSLDENKVCEI